MKKHLLPIPAMIIAVLVFCFIFHGIMQTPLEPITTVSWVNTVKSFDEAVKKSDLVVYGTVKRNVSYNNSTYINSSFISTNAEIEILEILKGNTDAKSLTVFLSGGTLNGVTQEFKPLKIPDEGDRFLFVLKNRYEGDGGYIPIDGYKGMFKTNKNGKIVRYNQYNRIEFEIRGKKTEEIRSLVKKFE